MQKSYIENFLTETFDNRVNYLEVFGMNTQYDPTTALISDVLGENKELLAEAILESLQDTSMKLQPQNHTTSLFRRF